MFQLVILLSQLFQLILFSLQSVQTEFQPAVARRLSELLSFRHSRNQHRTDYVNRPAEDTFEFFRQVFFFIWLSCISSISRARCLFYAIAVRLNVDNRTGTPLGTRREESLTSDAFSAEDRTQQFLFRRQLGFTFRRHLAGAECRRRLRPRADVNDTGFIQFERSFTHVQGMSAVISSGWHCHGTRTPVPQMWMVVKRSS